MYVIRNENNDEWATIKLIFEGIKLGEFPMEGVETVWIYTTSAGIKRAIVMSGVDAIDNLEYYFTNIGPKDSLDSEWYDEKDDMMTEIWDTFGIKFHENEVDTDASRDEGDPFMNTVKLTWAILWTLEECYVNLNDRLSLMEKKE